MAYESYINAGLTGAQNLINSNSYQAYPQFVASSQIKPEKMDYINYMPTSPLQQIQAPNYQTTVGAAQNYSTYNQAAPTYQGLMSGDYNALQQALYNPSANAAKTAYDTGLMNLGDIMSNRGMYGSSIMGDQMNNGLTKTYMNTLSDAASNAAAQRYQLQQKDLSNASAQSLEAWKSKLAENQAMNTYNQAARGQDITMQEDMNKYNATMFPQLTNQALNTWKSGLAEQQNKQAYDTAKLNWNQSYVDQLRDWQSKKDYEQFQYNLANRADVQSYNEQMINQNLALAGQGAPLSNAATAATSAANNYDAAIKASQNSLSAANTMGWLGAAGTLGGGLLSSGALSGLGSGISNLLGSNYSYNDWLGQADQYGLTADQFMSAF